MFSLREWTEPPAMNATLPAPAVLSSDGTLWLAYRIARDPTSLAETTAQLFFGIRMQCAKCHNHPFERWTQDDYYSMSAWFARVKQRKDPMQPGDAQNKDGAEYIYIDRAGEVTLVPVWRP